MDLTESAILLNVGSQVVDLTKSLIQGLVSHWILDRRVCILLGFRSKGADSPKYKTYMA